MSPPTRQPIGGQWADQLSPEHWRETPATLRLDSLALKVIARERLQPPRPAWWTTKEPVER